MVPIEIFGLQVEESSNAPLLLLRELERPYRVLPIFIGGAEAVAIVMGLQGLVAERPLTHDLLVDMLTTTETTLEEVAVTEVRDGTFLAELHLAGTTGSRVVSSRPSDAIALAVRLQVPLYASEEVMDEAGALVGFVDDGADGDGEDGDGGSLTEEAMLERALRDSLSRSSAGAEPPLDPDSIDDEVEELRSFLEGVEPADFAEDRDDPPGSGA